MAKIAEISGQQYTPTDQGYANVFRQYASSTYVKDHNMHPGLIVVANGLKDIQLTIQNAQSTKRAIATKTGGHQYSGASSTGDKNIQLDLSKAFRGSDDRKILDVKDKNKTFVRMSVSWSLGELNTFLGDHGCFVPTGQCTYVHLGGHAQTGGYGQLARSFGLLGDHITALEIVDSDGIWREINKQNHPDQFYAWVGGSPGNLGVLTHVTFEVHRDQDHEGSLGLQAYYLYNERTLRRLLELLVKMSDDAKFPRNYDFCISVLSQRWKIGAHLMDWEDNFRHIQEFFSKLNPQEVLPVIVVYAQWVKLSPRDNPNDAKAWFQSIRNVALHFGEVKQLPMSKMTKLWLFDGTREFDCPYVKRTYMTKSSTLGSDGWAAWVTKQIDKIVWQENGLYVSAQLQCFGGENSMFRKNADNGTSFSWRDSTVGCTIDCFHDDDKEHKDKAEAWEAQNDKESQNGIFSKQDRRLLWGSYGDWDLDAVRDKYYDRPEKYQKIQTIRAELDPKGTFTPNPFCVKAAKADTASGARQARL